MKINGLLSGTVNTCLMVGASGPAQAQSQDTRDIIADFCEKLADDAQEAQAKLRDAEQSLARCVDDFGDCRDGGLIGEGDPLVECLAEGLGCTTRASTDEVEACVEYKEEFADAYERALRAARFEDVEDEVQDFFNGRSRLRRICLGPAIQVAQECADVNRGRGRRGR